MAQSPLIKLSVALFVTLLSISCGKHEVAAPQQPLSTPFTSTPRPPVKREWGEARFDVCALLTREEVTEILGRAIIENKSAGGTDSALFISQCFYMAANQAVCAVVAVIEKDPKAPGSRAPNDLWEEMFEGRKKAEPEGEDEAEEAERRNRFPPEKITDLGYEAFSVNAVLYVLKGNRILRIAASGGDGLQARLTKAKSLAARALPRLQQD